MPVFKQRVVLAVKNARAFLELQVGLTRAGAESPQPKKSNSGQANRQANQKNQKPRANASQNGAGARENSGVAAVQEVVSEETTDSSDIAPENVIWILGNPKTGSTWLSWMMEEIEDHTVWREPRIGEVFGAPYYHMLGEKHSESKHYILGSNTKESWIKLVRQFILHEASQRFPGVVNGGYLAVKEPNGSVGAPLIMEALPESRMVFLVRDPRDVVSSHLDASRKGSYMYQQRKGGKQTKMFELEADELVRGMAKAYSQNISNTKEAYDSHQGPKVFVQYEDLRSDTLGVMKRIYEELGIDIEEEELSRAVDKQAWENISEEQKGEGKFHRKAQPGGWEEDLTEEQVAMVEEITAPLLDEFYPGWKEEKTGGS